MLIDAHLCGTDLLGVVGVVEGGHSIGGQAFQWLQGGGGGEGSSYY